MVKRQRRSNSKAKNKVMFKSGGASIDRISMLPDALLVSILSLLTYREAIITSLLSSRWRYLWTLIVPKLHFDGSEQLMKVKMAENNQSALHEERSKFVRWVDHVIELHKSCANEEFHVSFNLNKPYEKYIDKWVNYALARQVKRLELDLIGIVDIGLLRPSNDCYTFPFNHKCNSILFKYLEKISLNGVNVNGEALKFFLHNCPLLKHLSVSKSLELSTLKLVGPFPSLKHLEIISCCNLSSFEISDANLVSLKYMGNCIRQFLLKNVPLLVEIYIYVGRFVEMRGILSMLSSILPQLEKFRFVIDSCLCWKETERLFSSAVKMNNLKHLTMKVYLEDYLLPLTNILRASPCLETFVLETPRFASRYRKMEFEKIEGSYTHLKEVKFRGYCGSTNDLGFVMHLLESAGGLEKIVVDPCKPFDIPSENFFEYDADMCIRRENSARTRAKRQLVGILPPTINLQIL